MATNEKLWIAYPVARNSSIQVITSQPSAEAIASCPSETVLRYDCVTIPGNFKDREDLNGWVERWNTSHHSRDPFPEIL
jgi:hypothetical protein